MHYLLCEAGISILVTLIVFKKGRFSIWSRSTGSPSYEKMESSNKRISSYVYIPTPSLSVLKFSFSTSYYKMYLCPHAICTKEQNPVFIPIPFSQGSSALALSARQNTFGLNSENLVKSSQLNQTSELQQVHCKEEMLQYRRR